MLRAQELVSPLLRASHIFWFTLVLGHAQNHARRHARSRSPGFAPGGVIRRGRRDAAAAGRSVRSVSSSGPTIAAARSARAGCAPGTPA
jgi:hypothetical protein